MKRKSTRKDKEKEHRPKAEPKRYPHSIKFFNFPITLLREGLTSDVIVNQILPVCVYQYYILLTETRRIPGDYAIQVIERDFELTSGLSEELIENGLIIGQNLIRDAKESESPWASLPVWMISDYYFKDPPPTATLNIVSYAAYKSIIGTSNRKWVRTTNEMVRARMAGYKSPKDAILPDWIQSLSKYTMKKTREVLYDLWDFVYITPEGIRGFVFGFGITMDDLCYNYLSSTHKKKAKDEQKDAMERAKRRLNQEHKKSFKGNGPKEITQKAVHPYNAYKKYSDKWLTRTGLTTMTEDEYLEVQEYVTFDDIQRTLSILAATSSINYRDRISSETMYDLFVSDEYETILTL